MISQLCNAQGVVNYTTKHGLPSNYIYEVTQDEDGFIWMATSNGIAKYDGNDFRVFSSKDGLPNNDIWGVKKRKTGGVHFFSTSKYQGYIVKDSIYTFKTSDNSTIQLHYFYQSGSEVKMGGKYKLYHFKEGEITNYTLGDSILAQRQKNVMSYGLLHGDDILAILDRDKVVTFYDKQGCKVKEKIIASIPENLNYSNRTLGVINDGVGFFFFEEGILFIDYDRLDVTYVHLMDIISEKPTQRKWYVQNEWLYIVVDNQVLQFDEYGKFVAIEECNIHETYDGIYIDEEKNYWFNSLGNGVMYKRPVIVSIDPFFNSKVVQCITMLGDEIWVGVKGEGFYLYNETNQNYELKYPIPVTSSIYKIKSIGETDLFISANASYVRTNKKAERIVLDSVFSTKRKSYYYVNHFKDLEKFEDETYFISSNVIIKGDSKGRSPESYYIERGFSSAVVFGGELFLGRNDGLYKQIIDSLGNSILQKQHEIDLFVNQLYVQAGSMYMATSGRGVYKYDKEGNMEHLVETDGLNVKKVFLEDNFLWLATQNGVKKVALDQKKVAHSTIVDSYYETDGLLDDNVNDILLRDSFLYAASDIGMVKLNVNAEQYQKEPIPYFKNRTDTLVFEGENRNNITIAFSAIDFVNQDHLKFSYRLLPEHKTWSATKARVLNFSSLSPNLYTLEIKCIDQHFNTKIIRQWIKVKPYWYETLGAKLLFVSILIGAISGAVNYVKERAQNKINREQQLTGLELQALRSQMNPHFVHNSLNAIRYYIQENDIDVSELYLVKFSKLIRLFFEYSRRKTVTLEEEIQLLGHYLAIEQLRFEEKLEYEIKIDDNLDTHIQELPSMLLQPIVENAVNHGIFHKVGKGKVEVLFKAINEESFEVVVTDDGIGIQKSKVIYEESIQNYKSRSSHVLQERLDLLNRGKDWHVTYQIKDKQSEDGLVGGTMVSFVFKNLNS